MRKVERSRCHKRNNPPLAEQPAISATTRDRLAFVFLRALLAEKTNEKKETITWIYT